MTLIGSGILNLYGNDKNGIKGAADTQVIVNGLKLNIETAGNALSSDGSVIINEGSLNLISGTDALPADYILTIGVSGSNGPSIDIRACYEGFEGAEIYLYSGADSIVASDDGINAANSSLAGYNFKLSIYDGYWHVNAGGDGLDANGNIYLYGGTIESFGSADNDNAALDFDSKCYAESGILLTVGMAQNLSSGVYVTFGLNNSGGGWRPGGQGSSLSVTSDNTVVVKDSTGTVLYSATAVKTANSVIFAAPELASGQTYYLYINGTQVATATAAGIASVTPTVTAVTVTPDAVTLRSGDKQKFTATVSGTNNPSQSVIWTVIGGVSGTTISSDGTLTIASNETARTLVVKATSTADTTKSATATVTMNYSPVVYTITAASGIGGTVSGNGSYNQDVSVTLTATANNGYIFDGWYENNVKVSSVAFYTFTVKANRTLEARFIVLAVDLSFLDGEVRIWAESGIVPDDASFSVIKIMPPPDSVVEKVNDQLGASTVIIAYYEITLKDSEGNFIMKFTGDLTIGTKLPDGYESDRGVKIYQEDENGMLVEMESWTQDGYIFFKTNWLETY